MLTQAEFVESYCGVGARKAAMAAHRILLLGILAGFLIGMGAAATNTAAHGIANISLARTLSGLLFPFGLIMVIMTGAELFTGNCLMVIPLCNRRIAFGGMAYSLTVAYIGNFIGAVLLAYTCSASGQMGLSGGRLSVYAMKIASAKCSLSFGNAVVLGILCNVLVCIAVMQALSVKSAVGRAMAAYLPVAAFVICGFEHSVANMFYIPAGLFAASNPEYAAMAIEAGVDISGLTWENFLLNNLLPVTVGNIIGGMGYGYLIRECHGARA